MRRAVQDSTLKHRRPQLRLDPRRTAFRCRLLEKGQASPGRHDGEQKGERCCKRSGARSIRDGGVEDVGEEPRLRDDEPGDGYADERRADEEATRRL
jgi:hypothetical protein